MAVHPVLAQVTRRIQERSHATRTDYLEQVDAMAARPPQVRSMGCANVAHAFAALPGADKIRIVEEKGSNIASSPPITTCCLPMRRLPAIPTF